MAVGGINHCTGIMSLRLRDGRDAIPLVRERTTDEIVRWAIDTFGVVRTARPIGSSSSRNFNDWKSLYKGRAQGLAMRYGGTSTTWRHRTPVRSWEQVATVWREEGVVIDLPIFRTVLRTTG